MNPHFNNPFNLTKANDYSDAQIKEFWVDIPGSNGFLGMLKPTSPMPTLILGGKGSGKTHLMRYCSYEIQKLRHPNDLVQSIKTEGYLGIYTRCEGLNANRFMGKGQSIEVWRSVFEYYMELFLADLLLSHVKDLMQGTSEFSKKEGDFCRAINKLFDEEERANSVSLGGLITILRSLRKKIDISVNNCVMTRKLRVNVRATRSRLIFGIPKAIQMFDALRGIQVLYLIDELENFSEDQQKYVFTLVRERSGPCSMKIGSRLYGIKTYSTFSGGEEIKEGSEYEKLLLDENLRSNENRYNAFARKLIASKIVEADGPNDPRIVEATTDNLEHMFDEGKEVRFFELATKQLIKKSGGKDLPHFQKLRKRLALATSRPLGARNSNEISAVIDTLRVPAYPLLEKLNTMLIYRAWSESGDLARSAKEIARMCAEYQHKQSQKSQYGHVYGHFALDLLAQLFRENDIPQRYCGIEAFIHMSSGLPRLLLIILKHISNWSAFHGEQPFGGSPITIESQKEGVMRAASWFFDDARAKGDEGAFLQDCIKRLAELFREVRFSDKPVECSLCTFSVNTSKISSTAKVNIELAEKYSLLIRIPRGQKDRNSMRVDSKYQINSMLAPIWDLPIYRRGALPIDPELANAIFDTNAVSNFEMLLSSRISRMNAPFLHTKTAEGLAQPDFFEGVDTND